MTVVLCDTLVCFTDLCFHTGVVWVFVQEEGLCSGLEGDERTHRRGLLDSDKFSALGKLYWDVSSYDVNVSTVFRISSVLLDEE